MPPPPDPRFSPAVMRELFTNHELLAREAARPPAPPPGEEGSVRTVGILGGGTAGFFTALALRAQLPWLDVTVIETPSIPIIGVGEATVPSLVAFLHHTLKLDIHDLWKKVQPTWKQGIRFEWGLPGDYAFMAPFDWEVNGIGMLGSMAETGNINRFTVEAILMTRNATPIVRTGKDLQSFLSIFPFAYHLDNERLVRYLAETAIARGIKRIDAKIAGAKIGQGDDADPRVEHLITEDGRSLSFDLFIDCSGFRSFLLEEQLGAPFQSYASSLYTDAAVTFNVPHGGKLKPYTTARTMDHGWCWNIPITDSDHLGYVFSSAHCTRDEAMAEIRRTWPAVSHEREIRFRSGRHERPWVGNVYAVGNAFAFVEPLESTGLLMIMRAVTSLLRAFPIGRDHRVMKRFVNETTARDWDRLRWFLAVHYKFNKRLDTRFWQEVRADADVSGLSHALDLFQTAGPLSLLPRAIRTALVEATGIFFYGLAGLDNILLGQKVPYPDLAREPAEGFRARLQSAMEFARAALPQHEALRAVAAHPEWLTHLVQHPSSWVSQAVPLL